MKKFWKYFFISLAILLVLTIGGAALLAGLFEKQIGNKLIAEINKQLTAELTVERFDLRVITSFPSVAANLRGVSLQDSRDGVLLEAEKLSFRLSMMSVLGKSLKVKSVTASNGALSILVDEQGQPNYNIFKTTPAADTTDKKSTDGTAITLESARLQDIELIYADERARQTVLAEVRDAVFSGEFSNKQFSLNSKADIQTAFVELDSIRYLVGKKVAYDAIVFVNLEEGLYALKEVQVKIDDNAFRADGSIEQWDNGTYFDLFFTTEDGNLESVLQLLPESYMQYLSDFSSSGQFVFNASLKGLSNEQQRPEIRAELSLEDGLIKSPRLDNPFKDVSFTAKFNNGKYRDNESSIFELRDLKGYFNRELVEANFRIQNLDNPQIDFLLDGVVPVGSVYKLFNNPRITKGDGELEIKNLVLKGQYDDMINTTHISRVETGGELEFDDASLTINSEDVLIDRGRLKLQNNLATIEGLKIEGAGSDLEFNGAAFNILPVLFADSANTQRAELEFEAKLISQNLDIDRLMKLSAVAATEAEAKPEAVDSLKTVQIQKRERITNFLKGVFNATIARFNYNEIQGSDFSGNLEFDNNEMAIRGITTAMKGKFELDGRVFFEDEPWLSAKLNCGGIDVSEFFHQTGNFGQEVLTSENVKGTLHSKMTIDAYWDEEGRFLPDKLNVLAAIGIEDGELVNFEMLNRFSTFVKIKDLQHIRFTNLQNYLEVRRQKLFIPAMFIQSNALNLTVSGEHSFTNDFRYNLKVNAGQVLVNRLKTHDPTLDPIKARKSGFFNLHYTIFGDLENYDFKSAKKLVKSDFELSEQRKREIRSQLQEAFGVVELVDEPEEWRDIPEYMEGDPDKGEYLDEIKGGKKKSGGQR